MQLFQHRMRTSQHVKSVQSIMNRTNQHFFSTKTNFRKLSPQGDNITTYLRKYQISKENQSLAKRIFLCESQHSRQRYVKEWQNIKRFMKVRSNFKKTLHAQQPRIFKFQPIQGKGKLKVDFQIINIQMPVEFWSKKNLYKITFCLQNTKIQPDRKLMSLDLMKKYATTFYAPISYKRKKVQCKLIKVSDLNEYEVGNFEIDFNSTSDEEVQVENKVGKKIGKIKYSLKAQGASKKLKKISMLERQTLPSLGQTNQQDALKFTNES